MGRQKDSPGGALGFCRGLLCKKPCPVAERLGAGPLSLCGGADVQDLGCAPCLLCDFCLMRGDAAPRQECRRRAVSGIVAFGPVQPY